MRGLLQVQALLVCLFAYTALNLCGFVGLYHLFIPQLLEAEPSAADASFVFVLIISTNGLSYNLL